MKIQENVTLAPLTTLRVGGEARFFVEIQDEKDIDEVITFARAQNLPLFILGGGSNILIPDEGVQGVVLKMQIRDILVTEHDAEIMIAAGAGAVWNDVVDSASAHGVFGIANLAGIPGTVGGAAVQNIGAYGAELSTVFDHADVIESATGKRMCISSAAAEFSYRSSIFKKNPDLVIVRVVLRLKKDTAPNLTYPDVVNVRAEGLPLSTPAEIVRAIRDIRSRKFPQDSHEGTAGSFFKNPIVSQEQAEALAGRFPGLPLFPQPNHTVKIPLAWLFDRAFGLKGYALGAVRLYEKQPLVIVARSGANASSIDALAHVIEERVFAETGIRIEREVETFGRRA